MMDIAVPQMTGGPAADTVEECLCPPQYQGLSCQDCAEGHQRDPEGQCIGDPSLEVTTQNPRVRPLDFPSIPTRSPYDPYNQQQNPYDPYGQQQNPYDPNGQQLNPYDPYSQQQNSNDPYSQQQNPYDPYNQRTIPTENQNRYRQPASYNDNENTMKGYPRPEESMKGYPRPEESMKGYQVPNPSQEDPTKGYPRPAQQYPYQEQRSNTDQVSRQRPVGPPPSPSYDLCPSVTVTIDPPDQTIPQGGTGVLKCSGGNRGDTYIWEKVGSDLSSPSVSVMDDTLTIR